METEETDSSAAAAPSSAPAYPPAWLRGFLPAAVLAVAARGQAYGYAIAQDLDAAGLGHIKGGTLYPVLTGLERDGLLEATWSAGQGGPGRKLLTLTPAGRERLKEYRRQWADFTGAVGTLLGAAPSDAAAGEPSGPAGTCPPSGPAADRRPPASAPGDAGAPRTGAADAAATAPDSSRSAPADHRRSR